MKSTWETNDCSAFNRFCLFKPLLVLRSSVKGWAVGDSHFCTYRMKTEGVSSLYQPGIISVQKILHILKWKITSSFLCLVLTWQRFRTLTDQKTCEGFVAISENKAFCLSPFHTDMRFPKKASKLRVMWEKLCFSQASWHFLVIPGITFLLFHVFVTLLLHNEHVSQRVPRWPRSLSGWALD